MKNKNGFTLVELMIVIVIVGILMAYAIPAYNRQVIRSKRTEALNILTEIAAIQERHLANYLYSQYAATLFGIEANAILGLSDGFHGINAGTGSNDNYTYTNALDANNNFTLTAVALGTTQVNDNFGPDDCTTLTLDYLGVRGPLSCWQ